MTFPHCLDPTNGAGSTGAGCVFSEVTGQREHFVCFVVRRRVKRRAARQPRRFPVGRRLIQKQAAAGAGFEQRLEQLASASAGRPVSISRRATSFTTSSGMCNRLSDAL